MIELSEEQLDTITQATIPHTPGKSTRGERPNLDRPWRCRQNHFDDIVKSFAKAVERSLGGRDWFDDLETDKAATTRAQSRGQDRFNDLETNSKAAARAQSRGRDWFNDLDVDKSVVRPMVRARSQAL